MTIQPQPGPEPTPRRIEPPEPLDAPARQRWDALLDDFSIKLWQEICNVEEQTNGPVDTGRQREVTSGMVADAYRTRTDRRPSPAVPKGRGPKLLNGFLTVVVAVATLLGGNFLDDGLGETGNAVGFVVCLLVFIGVILFQAAGEE